MSLNATPSSERVHIGIFGKRNAGKSSLINAITGQNLAIVSEAKGTTTDPVYKAMELLPLGPVMIIDTPGIDDEGVLGSLRIQKAYQVLNKTDIALVIIDAAVGPSAEDLRLIKRINAKKIPLLIVINKCETINEDKKTAYQALLPNGKLLFVSAEQKLNIFELKEAITQTVPADENKAQIVADLLSPSDFVVLVVPIDSAAPKGRLILPQQQTIRDILEADAAAIVVKENELTNTLQNLGKRPKLVITDSQVFKKVAAKTPADILLTSFSILFARYKGNLQTAVQGVTALESLEDGDKILVGEGLLPMESIVKAFHGYLPQRLKIIAVAGHNEILQHRLEIFKEIPLTVYGFTDDVPELLLAADIVVTKAGGLTAAETLIAGCNYIIYKPLPGQETGNAVYLEQYCGAQVAGSPQEVKTMVCRYADVDSQVRLLQRQQRSLKYGKPGAAEEISNYILKKLEK